jgi:hypothetical protein
MASEILPAPLRRAVAAVAAHRQRHGSDLLRYKATSHFVGGGGHVVRWLALSGRAQKARLDARRSGECAVEADGMT